VGAGPIRLVTLAPELLGAERLVELLRSRGITISCGHSNATAEEANAAFDRGIRTVTHLFNAMRPFRHRDPGIAGAALAPDDALGVPLPQAVEAASTVPARVVGLSTVGRLGVELPADVVVLDDNLEIDRVFVGGEARVVA